MRRLGILIFILCIGLPAVLAQDDTREQLRQRYPELILKRTKRDAFAPPERAENGKAPIVRDEKGDPIALWWFQGGHEEVQSTIVWMFSQQEKRIAALEAEVVELHAELAAVKVRVAELEAQL